MEMLCLDFMNSLWYQTHDLLCEPFADPDWAAAFFRRWDLPVAGGLSEIQLAELLQLRDLLLVAMDQLAAPQSLPAELIQAINEYLGRTPLHYRLEVGAGKFAALLQPLQQDWHYVLTKICISFGQLIGMYRVERIKRCGNPLCRWVFYDESKNNSRKWCCNTCASLIKVRRFRAKRR